jgi:flagellar biosynthetic protein FliR
MLLLAIVGFLEVGGIGFIAQALARSYEAIPLASTQPSSVSVERLAMLVMASSGKLLESSVSLAAPVVVSLLLADIFLGVLCRAARSLPLDSIVLPIKAFWGVGVLFLCLAAIRGTFPSVFREFLELFKVALGLVKSH